MAMSTGGGPGGLNSEMNVTPFIDVLLVLLIIFMAIVPVTPKGLDALVPQPPKNNTPQPPNPLTVVLQIAAGGNGIPSYKINTQDVASNDLKTKLNAIYSIRAEKVLFIQGDPNLNFSSVAHAMDVAHSVGVDHIGLITPKMAAGQLAEPARAIAACRLVFSGRRRIRLQYAADQVQSQRGGI